MSREAEPRRAAAIARAVARLSVVVFLSASSARADVREDVAAAVNALRSAAADAPPREALKYLSEHLVDAVPVLRRELVAETGKPQPADAFLLDVGLFLYLNGGTDDREAAVAALQRLDPRAASIGARARELFECLHAMARNGDSRVLGLADRAFLGIDRRLAAEASEGELDSTTMCVYVFGAFGPASEDWLRSRLADAAVARRALDVLVWLGSPAALREVAEALERDPDHQTYLRVSTYMMQSAGPAGREYMLGLDAKALSAQSREYHAKIRKAVHDMSVRSFRTYFYALPGDTKLPDEEIARRLDAMIAGDGMDDRTNPVAFLDSGLSAEDLMGRLVRVRQRTLRRVSKAALADAQIVDALLNALRYRGR